MLPFKMIGRNTFAGTVSVITSICALGITRLIIVLFGPVMKTPDLLVLLFAPLGLTILMPWLAVFSFWPKTLEIDDSGIKFSFTGFHGWRLPWNEMERVEAPQSTDDDKWIKLTTKNKTRIIGTDFVFARDDKFTNALMLIIAEARNRNIPTQFHASLNNNRIWRIRGSKSAAFAFFATVIIVSILYSIWISFFHPTWKNAGYATLFTGVVGIGLHIGYDINETRSDMLKVPLDKYWIIINWVGMGMFGSTGIMFGLTLAFLR